MTEQITQSRGIAPADARRHRSWSAWAKVLAYAAFLALAIVSVWFINRRVDELAR